MLSAQTFESSIKARILGLQLIDVVGPEVLSAAVDALRAELKSLPRVDAATQ